MSNSLIPIFQTDLDEVHALLNLDIGTNLAAIGNKLYLINCGEITSDETNNVVEVKSTTTTTTTTGIEKPINISYPNGGEFLEIGSTITIAWSSDKSINDAVAIGLYTKADEYTGEVFSSSINTKTSNDGLYEWTIPASTAIGDNFRIKITWLSAGVGVDVESDWKNSDLSDKGFSIGYQAPVTTTTTTTLLDTTKPNISSCRGIPIMELPLDEYITDMVKDTRMGGILFATSKGRILTCRKATLNAYLTGDRNVYAEVKDGFGNESDTAWTSFMYALYNRIAKINDNKEVVKWKFEKDASAFLSEKITGEFLSPIVFVREDIGFWKTLTWTESKPDNTEVLIFLRSGDSAEDLQKKPWDVCFKSEDTDLSTTITRDILNSGFKGRYMQFRVVMVTDVIDTTPSVVDVNIAYSTKFAVYFYTTKFELTNDSGVKSGLLVANVTEPQGTEIIFGIYETNSSDWNDYEAIEVDKLFEIDNWERIKIGIKMISERSNIPEIAEFALITGSDINNLMNQ